MKEPTENLWLKIKFWTKLTIVFLVVVYIAFFIGKNSERKAQFWYWYNHTYSVSILILTAVSFLAGIVALFLVRTTYKTIRQVRSMRTRSRTERLEREVEDMKAKAAMLHTKNASQEPASSGESKEPTP